MNWTHFINDLFVLAEPYLEARGDLLHTRNAHQQWLFTKSALVEAEKELAIRRQEIFIRNTPGSKS